MIALIGPSGSGKTTIEQELIKRGYKRAISCTTRPPRNGEKHGLDYYFISEDDFKENIQMGLMAEYAMYKGHFYGLPISELSKDAVVVVEPIGYEQLKLNFDDNVFGCYLCCDEEVRKKRMINRGDEPSQVEERILNDKRSFSEVRTQVDYITNTSEKEVSEIVNSIVFFEHLKKRGDK